MPGMGHGLQTDNPTIAAAFRNALDHQLLILIVLGVVLALAWNLARTLQYRRAVAAGTLDHPVPGPWPYPEPPARRLFRIAFGLLWLFDGLLQIQGAMPLGLPPSVVTPAAGSSPGWVQHVVNLGTTVWSDHPVTAAAATVWIQVGIGAFLLVAPRGYWSRTAGLISAGWGLVVWVFGEAFGGVFGHGSSWLFGSPGAALFYLVAGLLVALPDRWWETPRSGRVLLRGMGVFFVGMGVLQAWPGRGFWSGQAQPSATAGTLTGMIRQMSQVSQPSVTASWVRWFGSFQAGHGWLVNFAVVAALIGVGASFLSNNLRVVRTGVFVGAALCLVVWVLVQDFGFFGGVGTDPNSMIPIVLLFSGGYLATVRPPAREAGGAPAVVPTGAGVSGVAEPGVAEPAPTAPTAPTGRADRLGRLNPNYLLRSLFAVGAVGILLTGAAPMALAAADRTADPILTEAANGTPDMVDVPAAPFTLTDQHGRPVSLVVLRRPDRGPHLPRPGVHLGLPTHRPGAAAGRPHARNRRRPCGVGGRGQQPSVHHHGADCGLRPAGGARPPGQLDLPDRIARPVASGVEQLRSPDRGHAGRGHDRPQRHRVPDRFGGSHPRDPQLGPRERELGGRVLVLGPVDCPSPAGLPEVSRPPGRLRRPWSRRVAVRASPPRLLAPLGALALAAGLLTGCSGPSTGAGEATVGPGIPLASSTQTGNTIWATLPMGHLDDPLNTFWELLALTGSRWELATPPGVASNGGLVVAAGPSSVLAGFEPSQDLRFSPLARSSDQGASWSPGVLPAGLAWAPDALIEAPAGSLALLRTRGGAVVATTGDLSSWKPATTATSLARVPTLAACHLAALTAVTFDAAGSPLVGASCAGGGQAGVFAPSSTGWVFAGPGIPGVVGGPTEVIRLAQTAAGIAALVSAGSGVGARLFGVWSTNNLRTWTVSSGLPLDGAALASTGITGAGGFVVTLTGGGSPTTASVVSPTGAPQWERLAAPPPGTTSVTGTPGGGFDALVPANSVLSVYSLGTLGWGRVQKLRVDIQYGSSG